MKKILSVLLVVLMLVGMLPMHAIHTHAAETTETELAILGTTGTLASDSSSISWTEGDITVTNVEGSTAIRTSDSAHYRAYQNSSFTIQSSSGNITKIVVTCTSNSYATVLKNSAGAEAEASGSTVTITPSSESSTYTIAKLTAQVRLNKVVVTTETAQTACEHTNTTTTTVDATCTADGSVTEVCDDCGETVSTSTTEALGHSFENGTCTVCGQKLFVVSFSVPSQVASVESITADENGTLTLPAAADYTGKYPYTFVGWAESKVADTETAPTIYTADSQYETTADVTLYAVYTYTVAGTGGSTEYVLADASGINPGDTVVIATTKDNSTYYAMSNGNGTSKAPTATKVTVSDGKLEDSNDLTSLKWDIGGSADAYIFYPADQTATWLYCTSTNNGVRVGTNTANTFKIDASSGYLYHNGTSRYIGVYNNSDWRCYTNTTGNIANQTLCFFVKTSGGAEYYTSTLEDVDSACTHENTTSVTVDATCTDTGSVTVTCDDCGATVSTTEISATGHTEVVDAAKDPTCVNTGLTEGSHCSVCNAVIVEQKEVPATGEHTYVDGTCSVCGAEEPSTGATEWQLVTDASALKVGDRIVIVAKNADVALSTTQNNNNRAVIAITKDTTNNTVGVIDGVQIITLESGTTNGTFAFYVEGDSTGYLYAASSGSNYLKTETALSANSSWLITIADGAATVKAQGTNSRNWLRYNPTSNIFSCYSSGQGDIAIYKEVVLCEHENTENHIAVAPTCTTVGYTEGVYCSDCESYIEGHQVVAMIDHSYDAGVQTTAPGCETTGVKTYTCTVCGGTKEESIAAAGHTMGEGVVVKATCETDGSKTYTCTVCGTQTVETVPATGHSWNSGEITTAATCETAGVRTYTCANAGCTKTEEIPATGHSWNEGETITAATCDAPGSILYTCQNDSTHTKTETISALGHTYVDGACTVCGSEVSHFKLVTDYKDILEGGQFVLAIRSGDTYYALGTADNTFGSDMPGCVVTVQGSGADSWVEWTDTVPVWNVAYYANGQNNSFTLSYGGTYLTHTGGTSFGSASDPFAWTLLNKDADGNNEYDNDYAVIAEDGVVSYYTASSKELNRSINLYKTSPDVYFRTYSNNNNFDTVCFFKVVKTAGESCTVTFMENGSNTMSQTVANGEYIALPEPTLDTYPSGYTHFVGWVTLPCLETLTAPDEIYYVSENAGDQDSLLQVTEDMTLYALYSRTDPDAEGQSMSYYQVTDESQLVVGQYYIIVGYDAANDKWFAMSLDQYADARGGSWITPDENGVITITPNDRVATFHLEQGYNTGSYGFFDVIGNRFLSASAATEDNNSLRSADTLGVNESFTIAINADGSYSIISMEKDSVTYLVLYNTNDNKNPLFSCYDNGTGIDTTKTYLYVGQTNTVPGTYYATGTCEHDYQQTAHVDASCTTAGYTQYTCSICGEVKFDDVYAHGHNLGEATVIEPTCTQAGSSTSVCQNEDCGEEWVEVIPALGHTEVTDAAVEATCTTTGLTEGSHCSVCNEVLVAQEEIPALGHDYVGTVEINEQNVPVLTHQCSRCDDNYSIELKFNSANPVLENTLIMNFKTLDNIAGEDGFTNVRATFLYGQRDLITVNFDEALAETGKYVFPCKYITPSQVGDTITATIYGTYGNVEYSYQMEYSVAEYCYNMLEKDPENTELRTLLVDLLYYCDYARAYTTYKDDESVTAALTEEQKAFASADRELSTVTNINYAPAENEKATWKAASLIMYHSTRMQLRFALAEGTDIANVTVKVLIGSTESVGFITESTNYPGQYLVTVDELAAHQLSTPVYVTLYEGETAISNTICYSAESYAYNKQNDSDVKLVNLVKAMMRYGNSAKEYMS